MAAILQWIVEQRVSINKDVVRKALRSSACLNLALARHWPRMKMLKDRNIDNIFGILLGAKKYISIFH
jgi:hypothetical protein